MGKLGKNLVLLLPSLKRKMARFLNVPMRIDLGQDGNRLLLEPLLFQYAGNPVPPNIVGEYLEGYKRLVYDCNVNWKASTYRKGYKDLQNKLVAQLEDEHIWIVPPGKITDGPSIPKWARPVIDPATMNLSGYLHDDLRVKFTTGNMATDGFLFDAVRSEGGSYLKALVVFSAVRVGTHTGFKSTIPTSDIISGTREYARYLGCGSSELTFDTKFSEIRIL